MTPPTVRELLTAALPRARWFAAKGRATYVRALIALPPLTSDELSGGELPVVSLEVAEILDTADTDHVEHYLLALCYRPPHGPPGLGVARHPSLGLVAVHDATDDEYATEILWRFTSTAHEHRTATSRLTSHVLPGIELAPVLPGRRFGGEQSNTSILYADIGLLKIFRMLPVAQDGLPAENLDIEVHRALAQGPARERLTALWGWVEAQWSDSTGQTCRADLAMLVEQFPRASNAWDVAVASVVAGQDFAPAAAEIGVALRDVHAGLVKAFGRAPVGDLITTWRDHLTATVRQVPALAAMHAPLDQRLTEMGPVTELGHRVHGDFHLGQVLHAPDSATAPWRIIDFEGEPLRPLAERRAWDTGWRDVAGLLRSLDYAGAHAVRTYQIAPQEARDWVVSASEAFVAAYAGRNLTPTEADLVDAYLIDKAVYECRYEQHNRPDWLPIPLAALAAHLAPPAAPTAIEPR